MKILLAGMIVLASFLSPVLFAQDDDSEEIVVTGMRATQGGAQDIDYFRGQVAQAKIPHPNTITAEGLFSQHDILFPASEPCQQLFCLTQESTHASLISKPEAILLTGLGFATNLDEKSWKREPLNLIAVIDKSGSMAGRPLDLVKRGLTDLLKQLTPEDQLSIVLYGDTTHVHLAPTRTDNQNKKSVQQAIDSIQSAGSTYMEAGLTLGYLTANESAKTFDGNTRVMLFTDERPNVGNTSANSFMGMAIDASKQNIGLTTIGVGDQFGAELATKISSVRGGNLFFINSEQDVDKLFATQLDTMVSELAHDLTITITPNQNLSIAGVYGIPGEMLGWQGNKSVSFTVPTVFLSTNGGAIFFALAKPLEAANMPFKLGDNNLPLAKVELSYISAKTGKKEQNQLSIANPSNKPASDGMQLGHLLVDEYTTLFRATTEHYFNNDQETAYQLLNQLYGKINQTNFSSIEMEKTLVGSLLDRFAFLSGHQSENQPKSNYSKLWGTWKLVNSSGNLSLKRNDLVTFDANGVFNTFRTRKGVEERIEHEDYQSNESQFYLEDSEITFDYYFKKDKLHIKHKPTGVKATFILVDRKIHK
jgi:Ca-activated chloride channel homolog